MGQLSMFVCVCVYLPAYAFCRVNERKFYITHFQDKCYNILQ